MCVDFRKVFDSVYRIKLWNIVRKQGVNEQTYRAITCMYNVVKAQVRSGSDLTDSFMCPRGLMKQGDNCSPICFSCSLLN